MLYPGLVREVVLVRLHEALESGDGGGEVLLHAGFVGVLLAGGVEVFDAAEVGLPVGPVEPPRKPGGQEAARALDGEEFPPRVDLLEGLELGENLEVDVDGLHFVFWLYINIVRVRNALRS